jgi:hypothetical protein
MYAAKINTTARIAQSEKGWATGWTVEEFGVDFQQGHIPTSSRLALWPTQPPIQSVPGVLPLGVKLTTSTSAEVKNTWIYTFTPPYLLMA